MITTEVRFGDDVQKCYYAYVQPQFSYIPTDWISLAPGYRQIVKRYPTNSNHWIPEYVPIFDLVLTGRAKEWKFEHRSRVEYIISRSSSYPWLYRDRFRVFLPIHWTQYDITPFFDNEIFWREANGINEDRVAVGIKEKFTSFFTCETSYTARFLKAIPHWTQQNVFLIWFNFFL